LWSLRQIKYKNGIGLTHFLEQHCHIAWHIAQGLGLQYVEQPSQIVFPDQATFAQTCNNYKAYQSNKASDPYGVTDSGL
jgi:hypothetical protein